MQIIQYNIAQGIKNALILPAILLLVFLLVHAFIYSS